MLSLSGDGSRDEFGGAVPATLGPSAVECAAAGDAGRARTALKQ